MGKIALLAVAPMFIAAATNTPDLPTSPIPFHAEMSVEEQPADMSSAATGTADLLLDRETLQLKWVLSVSGTKTKTVAVHIHNARSGTNGRVVYDLTPALSRATGEKISGSLSVSEAELGFLLGRNLYIDIHTEEFPEGEIRGQIERGTRVGR